MRTLGLWLVALSSCVQSNSVDCGGYLCPAGNACDHTHGLCVLPDQLVSCAGRPDYETCEVEGEPATCLDGVCLLTICGDRVVEPGEYCEADPLPQDSCFSFGWDAGSIGCNLSSCAADLSGCVKLEWQTVSYKNGDVWSIWASSEHDVFAVGAFGKITHWGYSGEAEVQPTTAFLTSVHGSASNNVFVVGGGPWNCPNQNQCPTGQTCNTATGHCEGGGGKILRYDGNDWSEMESGTSQNLRGVWVASPADAFAVGERGTILHFDGATWSAMASPTTVDLSDVWGTSPTDVFAVGGSFATHDQQTILHYNGSQWTPMAAPAAQRLNSVWGSSSSNVFAVGVQGTILRYNGTSWQPMMNPASQELWDVSGSGPDAVYATGWAAYGESPPILNYDGRVWTAIAAANFVYVTSVFAFANSVFTASFNGIFRTEGALWSKLTLPIARSGQACGTGLPPCARPGEICDVNTCTDLDCGDPPPFGTLAVVADDQAFAISSGKLYEFLGYDFICTQAAVTGLPTNYSPRQSHVFADGGFATVQSSLVVVRLSNGGFVQVPAPANVQFSDVWGTSVNDVFVSGTFNNSEGRIYRWNGVTLMPMQIPAGIALLGNMAGRSGSDIYAAGQANSQAAVLHYNGVQWRQLAFPFQNVFFRDIAVTATSVWATGAGKLFRYDGTSWTEITTYVPVPFYGTRISLLAFTDDDVFVFGQNAQGRGEIVHYNGIRTDPVRVDAGEIISATGSRRRIFITGGPQTLGEVRMLDRLKLWSCRGTEIDCADGVDDDCDGVRDTADSDCN